MDTWFLVDLGDGIEAYEPSLKIQKAFSPIFLLAKCPKNMAVFSRYDLKKNIVTAYFTPSAHQLAKMFKAVPCKQPSKQKLGMLVGDVRAWEIYFPGVIKR